LRLKDLIKQTGLAERQVRYLITEGFIPPPKGGRATAYYGDSHVSGIKRYLALKDLGFPPAAIRLLLDAKPGVPLALAPGITLIVSPELIGSSQDIVALQELTSSAFSNLFTFLEKGPSPDDIDTD